MVQTKAMIARGAKHTSHPSKRVKTRHRDINISPSTQPTSSDAHCTLLSLPPEIGNQIYELALVQSPYIEIFTDKCSGGAQPALTRTCLQIRNESLGLFYELNTSRVSSGTSFLRDIGPINQYVDKVKILQLQMHAHPIYVQLNLGETTEIHVFALVRDERGPRRRCDCYLIKPGLERAREMVEKVLSSDAPVSTWTKASLLGFFQSL